MLGDLKDKGQLLEGFSHAAHETGMDPKDLKSILAKQMPGEYLEASEIAEVVIQRIDRFLFQDNVLQVFSGELEGQLLSKD